jgi:hypothetical protein
MDTSERAANVLRKIPALRPLAELIALQQGETDILEPDGEVAYRRTLKQVLASMGSFRTTSESNQRLAIDAIVALEKESSKLLNRYFVEMKEGDPSNAIDAIQKFNTAWPDSQISGERIMRYLQRRAKEGDKTALERKAGKKIGAFAE